MRGGGIQPNSDIVGRNNQREVDILIVIKIDLLDLDDEEISLYGCLIERDIALHGFHLFCLVGDCDAHGVDG